MGVINDDWFVKKAFDKLVEALDELLAEAKDSNLLDDESFVNWTDKLYKVIDKYND